MKRKTMTFLTALSVTLTSSFMYEAFAEGKQKALTPQQKNQYYQQYAVILRTINSHHPDTDLELVDQKSFKEKDWVTPNRFRKIAEDRVKVKFASTFDFSKKESTSKSKTIHAKETTFAISITGTFDTALREEAERQVFKTITSMTSTASSSKGTWRQLGYTATLMDGGRTYDVTVGGEFIQHGISSTHNIPLEFYCSAEGVIN